MAKRKTKSTKRKSSSCKKVGGFLPFPINILRQAGNTVGDKILKQMGIDVFATGTPPHHGKGHGRKY